MWGKEGSKARRAEEGLGTTFRRFFYCMEDGEIEGEMGNGKGTKIFSLSFLPLSAAFFALRTMFSKGTCRGRLQNLKSQEEAADTFVLTED